MNATISLTNSGVGYTSNSHLTLNNSNGNTGNTAGVPSVEYYKSGRNAVVNDLIASQQFNANNYLGTKTTFGKIESIITSSSAPTGDDGALDFYTCVNGISSLVLRLNGADNENNSFRPLDMNGQIIKTSTGNLDINTTASIGTGNLNLYAKQHIQLIPGTAGDIIGLTSNGNISMTANGSAGSTPGIISLVADRSISLASAQGGSDGSIILDTNSIGDIYFVGSNLETPTAGSNSGQYLRIRLNGTYYKIQLLNDT